LNDPVFMSMWNFTPSEEFSQQSKLKHVSLVIFPFFCLTTPFLVFLDYYDYGLFRLEIFIGIFGFLLISLLCSAAMKCGGFIGNKIIGFTLITIFFSIQFGSSAETAFTLMLVSVAVLLLLFKENFNLIAAAIFATFFVVTLSQALFPKSVQSLEFKSHAIAGESRSLPRIIHIILDEHIGLEGIPTDIAEGVKVKTQLRKFYNKYGFMTFDGAYSHYFHTVNSVGNLLNFSAAPQDRTYISEGESPNKLLQNHYFESLSQAGYRLNVWWGHHLDYCSYSPVVIDNCIQVPPGGLQISQHLSLQPLERLQLVFSAYLNLSNIYQGFRNYYQTFRNQIIHYGVSLPSATWDRHLVTALPYLDSINVLWQNILILPEGSAIFAHLLLPHYPYVANSDCTIKSSIKEWKYSSLLFTPYYPYQEGVHNTDVSRKTHYQEYLKQVQCLYVKLDELFQRMETADIFKKSIVIIHGDHGSRIVRMEPSIENEQELSKQDYIAGYSTLFAVKFPKQLGGNDTKPYPIEYLLREKVVNNLLGKNGTLTPPTPFVFLRSEDLAVQALKRVPYPLTP